MSVQKQQGRKCGEPNHDLALCPAGPSRAGSFVRAKGTSLRERERERERKRERERISLVLSASIGL